MKFIRFDTTTVENKRVGRTSLRMHKSGLITINKKAVAELEIEAGETAALFQDEESPNDWYLVLGDKSGFPLKQYKDAETWCFNNSYIVKEVMRIFESVGTSIRMEINCEEIKSDDPDYKGKGRFYKLDTENISKNIPDDKE